MLRNARALEPYGFAGGTFPSPDGGPGQGWRVDPQISDQFDEWFAATDHHRPWCTTVSFVNPHDIAWWWHWSDQVPREAEPPSRVRALPPNFETAAMLEAHRKPLLQRSLQQTAAASFGPVPLNGSEAEMKAGWLPFMDLYLQLQHMVDRQIGRVLHTLHSHPHVAANTVVLFTSDHGEYGASHGLRGKGASAYEEAIRVPLIVKDPRGVLSAARRTARTQLTSSVDIAPLLLSIATGSNAWRNERLGSHLAQRADLAGILTNPRAAGRRYVLHATDEIVTEFAVETYAANAPLHVVALRTARAKYVTYSNWSLGSTVPEARSQERELYDYSSRGGRLELHNVAGRSHLERQLRALHAHAVRTELRGSLPHHLDRARTLGFENYYLTATKAAVGATAARLRRQEQGNGPLAPVRQPRPRPSGEAGRAAGQADRGLSRTERAQETATAAELPQRLPRGSQSAHRDVSSAAPPPRSARSSSRSPARGALATGARLVGEGPARTCHEATSVAPFQLASTLTPAPRGLRRDGRRRGRLPAPRGEVGAEVLHVPAERPVEQHVPGGVELGEVRQAAVAEQPVAAGQRRACCPGWRRAASWSG